MVRLWIGGLLLAGVAGCAPGGFQDQVTRNAARSVITPVVAREFPGVPLQPAIDCVINNASSAELIGLAGDALTGPTAATTQSVVTIAARPDTVRCFALEAAPVLLRGTR